MELSPLVQQSRPTILKAKIVGLYESLFQDEHFEESEGFWREFFLLKPDPAALRTILNSISTDALLHHHEFASRLLFRRAIQFTRTSSSPSDEIALDTLTAFLEAVLSKKFPSPSSDIITLLAGLEEVDIVFTDLVTGLDEVIKNGKTIAIRQKAVRAAIAAVAGTYRTGLVSYFMNRDLFPALAKLFQDLESPNQGYGAFSLLGLLTSYGKFEFANPYRLRLDDYVEEEAMRYIVHCVGDSLASSRDTYTALQENQQEGWMSFGSTLSVLSLGIIGSGSATASGGSTEADFSKSFTSLPSPETMILLSTYEFVTANKLFSGYFTTSKALEKEDASPFASFLSMSSYLLQNAYRTSRSSTYACLCILILQTLMEDSTIASAICSNDNRCSVRLCRQRLPLIPAVSSSRIPITVVLDVLIGGLAHNLQIRLNLEFYDLLLNTLLRILTHLSSSQTRIVYHWGELWRTLLSFLRFLISHPVEIAALPSINTPIDAILNILAFAITSGESFLPDTASFEDLLYKLLGEAASSLDSADKDMFIILRTHFDISTRPDAEASVELMVALTRHYRSFFDEQKGKKDLGPKEVSRIIKQGYETLDLPIKDGWGAWDKFRDVERKALLKGAARVAVADVKILLAKHYYP